MKVKITKQPCWKGMWYYDKVGEVFEIFEPKDEYFGLYYILLEDRDKTVVRIIEAFDCIIAELSLKELHERIDYIYNSSKITAINNL